MLRRLLTGLVALTILTGASAQDASSQNTAYKGELPILNTGYPKASLKKTFVLEITKQGRLRHDGKELSAAALKAELRAFAKRHPSNKAIVGRKTSWGQLHLRAHPELPYAVLAATLDLCAEPQIAIYRVFLGIRSKEGGPELAFPLFIPIDGKMGQWGMSVAVRYTVAPADNKILKSRFDKAFEGRNNRNRRARSVLVFEADANVPIPSLLRIVYAARRSGFDDIALKGIWRKLEAKRDFATLAKQHGARPAGEPGAQILSSGRLELLALEEEVEEIEEEIEEEVTEEEVVEDKFDRGGWKKPVLPRNPKYAKRRQPPKGEAVAAKVAIQVALQWLAKHQDEDGKWDADGFMKHDRLNKPTDGAGNAVHDVGVTGLALLAFLGDGNTMRSGPHKNVVKKAVKWLREQQHKNGLFGTNASHDFIYDHAIATWAMVEAYGLSQYRVIKRNAQMGINYLESHRNPYAVWRYQPRDNDNDMSVTSWCIMAYKAGQDFGLDVNKNALKIAESFIDEVTDPATGRAGYTKRGERSSRHPGDHSTRFPIERGEALTAAALFGRFILGQTPARQPVMKQAAATILEKPPQWNTKTGSIDMYYWDDGTYAMYQMGGNHWLKWQRKARPAVLENQRKDGNSAGSWDPVGVWGESGGRIYSTAMMTLTLQAVFRYSRLQEKPVAEKPAKKNR